MLLFSGLAVLLVVVIPIGLVVVVQGIDARRRAEEQDRAQAVLAAWNRSDYDPYARAQIPDAKTVALMERLPHFRRFWELDIERAYLQQRIRQLNLLAEDAATLVDPSIRRHRKALRHRLQEIGQEYQQTLADYAAVSREHDLPADPREVLEDAL